MSCYTVLGFSVSDELMQHLMLLTLPLFIHGEKAWYHIFSLGYTILLYFYYLILTVLLYLVIIIDFLLVVRDTRDVM